MEQILKLSEVAKLTRLSRATVYRASRNGSFPAAVRLSQRVMGWRRSDVEQWLQTRPKWISGPARSPGRKRRGASGGEAPAPGGEAPAPGGPLAALGAE